MAHDTTAAPEVLDDSQTLAYEPHPDTRLVHRSRTVTGTHPKQDAFTVLDPADLEELAEHDASEPPVLISKSLCSDPQQRFDDAVQAISLLAPNHLIEITETLLRGISDEQAVPLIAGRVCRMEPCERSSLLVALVGMIGQEAKKLRTAEKSARDARLAHEMSLQEAAELAKHAVEALR